MSKVTDAICRPSVLIETPENVISDFSTLSYIRCLKQVTLSCGATRYWPMQVPPGFMEVSVWWDWIIRQIQQRQYPQMQKQTLMNKIKFPTVNESMVDKILVGPTMNTSSNASSSAKRLYLAQFLIFMFILLYMQ